MKRFVSLALFRLALMIKRYGCTNLFCEKGAELREYVKQIYFANGKNNFSSEVLEEDSGVSADIFKNIFSGRTEISLVHLLYLIFTLKMERYHALAFLSFFGFSRHCLDYSPYREFSVLIGDYSNMGDLEAKKYVDEIINRAITNHSKSQ